MTIYTYLKKDHDTLKKLLAELEEMGNEKNNKLPKIFNTLKAELIIHSKAEEKVFYKALEKFEETKEKIAHSKEEHAEAELLIEELTDNSLNGAAWHQKFIKLKDALEHHIKEEENEIFVEAKKVLDSNVALEMETAIRKAKENEQQRTITKREED